MIEQLSELLDPLSLRAYIVKRSKYGKVPSKAGPWAYTEEFIREYGTDEDVQAVVSLFEGCGIRDELTAGRFLLRHDELVP